jgi:hypothetical protein
MCPPKRALLFPLIILDCGQLVAWSDVFTVTRRMPSAYEEHRGRV